MMDSLFIDGYYHRHINDYYYVLIYVNFKCLVV